MKPESNFLSLFCLLPGPHLPMRSVRFTLLVHRTILFIYFATEYSENVYDTTNEIIVWKERLEG